MKRFAMLVYRALVIGLLSLISLLQLSIAKHLETNAALLVIQTKIMLGALEQQQEPAAAPRVNDRVARR